MDDYLYETGSTQPPKSRFFMVLLLVILIFLGGIITALGILNIKLWNSFSLKEKESVSLRFTRQESCAAANFGAPQSADPQRPASLGVVTETVSPFSQAYYHLPKGVYLPQIPEGSNAAIAGILPGDILVAMDGHTITDTETLNKCLSRYNAQDRVELTLYRDGKNLSLHLTLSQGE